ncbi:MAG: valine--tRNA ligase [Bacillales bacterium]|jgi:valyl-tRNA synthetase|nr:valine--tRNA ligase [Bacillales bacterium]
MKELETKYDHLKVEEGKYDFWLKKRVFESGQSKGPAYTIVIPPPNVTGKLHLGHAVDTTLQDILIRYKKMQGFDTLWVPGMDHAGIATQAKVEARLMAQGINKYDLGRENFLKQSWAWKEEYADFIHEQWKKLGLSLDYTKERFTLDEGLNKAVTHVFVSLYNKGLIYQGERIINWDIKLKTALSNIEVIYKPSKSKMYYFKYAIPNSQEYIPVATTRPETMFADECVVINARDPRYLKYLNKMVINPSNNELVPVIADNYVEIDFGTGAMKCTPAHDPNDYLLGKKYNLRFRKCLNKDGTVNELGHKYAGLDRFVAREEMVKDMLENGSLIKIETIENQVGYSERSDTIVEPYLSKQWFVKMKPLAEQVIKYQKSNDKINFYPARFEKTLIQWMENIEDWCISRQLWWGHQIPVWYRKDSNKILVSEKAPTDIENYKQDEDVLDTWFSSALWPFSTLGWPENSHNYQKYYPNSVLVTAYDIIFFWVSRMIFEGIEFTHQKPFNDVLIHGLIRDEQGRKMTKSLGNGIDPMDIIAKYGADSLRYFLISGVAPGLDTRFSIEKIEASWNFINKIWNASRYILMNIGLEDYQLEIDKLELVDNWIINKYNELVNKVTLNLDKYEFGLVCSDVYSFIYDYFCSWYIELAKVNLNSDNLQIRNNSKAVLKTLLIGILKILHPIMPFVTEEIYQSLINSNEVALVTTNWPKEIKIKENGNDFNYIIDIITSIRSFKSENNIIPSKTISLYIKSENKEILKVLEENRKFIGKFTYAPEIVIDKDINNSEIGKTIVLNNITLFIPMTSYLNIKEEIININKNIDKINFEIKRGEGILNNKSFIEKAPPEKIREEKEKLSNNKQKLKELNETLAILNNNS